MPVEHNGRRGPTVFVGIPTRNRPRFVREAIRSVLAQTYPYFRLVVSDNQSAPEAATDVACFVRELNDPRVTYFLQAANGGEYGQGRYLVDCCREDYFIMLHDDDLLEPEHLAFAVRVMEADPQLAFLSTNQRAIDEDGRPLPDRTREYDRSEGRAYLGEGRIEKVLDLFMRHGGVFSVSGALFRTAVLRKIGLVDVDCEGLYPFEYNVFLRQAESGWPAYFSTRKLVAYRHHPGTMRNYARPFFNRAMMRTMITLLERRRFSGRAEWLRRRLLGAVCRNYAFIMHVAGDRGACYRFLGRALRLYPFSPRTWLYTSVALTLPFLILPIWGPRITLESRTGGDKHPA